MRDARLKGFWHRAGPFTALGVIVAAAAAGQGCGGGDSTATSTTGSTTETTSSSSSSGPGGTGGGTTSSTSSTGGGSTTSSSSSTGGTGGSMGSPQPPAITVEVQDPLDVTPDPDGKILYFTANGPNGLGVYTAPADGSMPSPTAVYPTQQNDPNNPFHAPLGISIGTNGKTLYVADSAGAASENGVIYSLPVGGGLPTIVMGTDGYKQRGLDVYLENGSDVIYFTGIDTKLNKPGVFKVPVGGGMVTAISIDPVFRDLSGITVATNGDVYVVDCIGFDDGTSQVYKIPVGSPKPAVVISGLHVGYPAGIALALGDQSALVSGLNAGKWTDRLFLLDLNKNTATELFAMELGGFTESAGMHRAKNQNVFGWADGAAGPLDGRVFTITYK